MNSKHAGDVLAAAAACDPAGDYAAAREAVAAAPGAEWELSVCGSGAVPRLSRRGEPPARGRSKPFRAADFDEPVASALAAFDALAGIAAVERAPGDPGWTLVLRRPLAWPLFLRCDLAASFAPRAAALTLLLRDARVVALDFDGEALWARCVG